MIYVIQNKNHTHSKKIFIDFFKKNNIEYKIINGSKIPVHIKKYIFDMGDEMQKLEFFNRNGKAYIKSKMLKLCAINEIFKNELDNYFSNYWFVDFENKKVLGKVNENELCKFIPKEKRKQNRMKMLHKLYLMDKEKGVFNNDNYEEEYYLSDEFLE